MCYSTDFYIFIWIDQIKNKKCDHYLSLIIKKSLIIILKRRCELAQWSAFLHAAIIKQQSLSVSMCRLRKPSLHCHRETSVMALYKWSHNCSHIVVTYNHLISDDDLENMTYSKYDPTPKSPYHRSHRLGWEWADDNVWHGIFTN